jgi:hypothetical protein
MSKAEYDEQGAIIIHIASAPEHARHMRRGGEVPRRPDTGACVLSL